MSRIDAFSAYLKTNGKSQNTIKGYVLDINQYFKWFEESFGQECVALYRQNVLDYVSYLLGKDLDMITRISMMKMVEEREVNVHTETALTEVCSDRFKVKHGEQEFEIPFDLGFVCLGMRSFSPLMDSLLEYGKEHHVEVVNIGDSKQARRIIDGTREGRNILKTIQRVDEFKNEFSYSY